MNEGMKRKLKCKWGVEASEEIITHFSETFYNEISNSVLDSVLNENYKETLEEHKISGDEFILLCKYKSQLINFLREKQPEEFI